MDKNMFKLSWFGKAMLASKAIEKMGEYLDNKKEQETLARKFSENEVRALSKAVQEDDYDKFARLYLLRRPDDTPDDVSEAYDRVKKTL